MKKSSNLEEVIKLNGRNPFGLDDSGHFLPLTLIHGEQKPKGRIFGKSPSSESSDYEDEEKIPKD